MKQILYRFIPLVFQSFIYEFFHVFVHFLHKLLVFIYLFKYLWLKEHTFKLEKDGNPRIFVKKHKLKNLAVKTSKDNKKEVILNAAPSFRSILNHSKLLQALHVLCSPLFPLETTMILTFLSNISHYLHGNKRLCWKKFLSKQTVVCWHSIRWRYFQPNIF